MNRKFTNEQEQQIISRYLSGESPKKIANVLDTSDVTVRNILTRHNVPRRRTRKLSIEHEKEIVSIYEQGKSSIEIAQLYPLSPKAIRNLLHAHNVNMRVGKLFNEETELWICKKYLEDRKSTNQLAAELKCSKEAIRRVLQNNNVETRSRKFAWMYRKPKYKKNDHFFSKIDNEKSAYWLGMLAADGHVDKKGGRFYLDLKESDAYHVEQFAIDLESDAEPVPTTYHSVRLTLMSRKIADDLRALGLHHDKSYTLKFPDIPEEQYRHFLRGLFDGDGSIAERSNNPRYHVLEFAGTKDIIESVRTIISETLGVSAPKIYRRKCSPLHTVKWGSKAEILEILDWFYEEATVYLKRKHDMYLSIPREYPPLDK
jgi:intein-encoded DNA endonuclease-like protein